MQRQATQHSNNTTGRASVANANHTVSGKATTTAPEALPEDTTQALRTLIRFSEHLLDLSERETQALVQNDLPTFSVLQNEKDVLARRYAGASNVFRSRLNEFRTADRLLLNRLEALQNDIADKVQSNSRVVERLFTHSQKTVHQSLVTVQELAQKKPLNFAKRQGE